VHTYQSVFITVRAASDAQSCDRTVISQARNLDEHRGFRTHIDSLSSPGMLTT
jgi:hypothetical protein